MELLYPTWHQKMFIQSDRLIIQKNAQKFKVYKLENNQTPKNFY